MKHIRVKVYGYGKLSNCWYVRIVEQTHRGHAFGVGGTKFEASNGVVLESQAEPSAVLVETPERRVYMRGNLRDCDWNLLEFSSKETLDRFLFAVKEYNMHFSVEDDALCVVPPELEYVVG